MIKNKKNRGFTIIEMLAVLAIFGIMTSITLFNYNKFRSETILTNMAYEVALSVREAQIYGVSVRSPSGQPQSDDFRYPYGVHFNINSDTYYLFVDENENGAADCALNECITPYTLQRGMIVSRVQKECTGAPDSLDVLFRRPNPEAIFDGSTNVSYAEIEIKSPDEDLQYVLIRNNGQIEVKSTSECS